MLPTLHLSRLIAPVVLMFVLASCNSGPEADTAADPVPDAPAGFVSHNDPLGFSLQRPADWGVIAPSLNDIAVVDPAGTSAALIRARLVRGDLAQWLAGSYLGTEAGVQNFESLSASSDGGNVARTLLRYFDAAGNEKRASVVAVRQGDLATVFAAMAPRDVFESKLPLIAQILDSFRFTPQTGQVTSPAQTGLRFVNWVEPFESAWAMEVPDGWVSEGGLIRRPDGVRAAWQLTDPAGTALIYGGDLNTPPYYVLPTETSLSLGFQEGQPTGPNGPIMLRFQEAVAMGPQLFQQHFGAAQVVNVRERPDMIESLQRNPLLGGGVARISAAEIEFILSDGRVGIMALATYGQEVEGLGGTWNVDNVHGFVATADRVADAGAALGRAIGTSRENPDWRRGEAALQAQLAAQYQDYLAFSNNLQRQTIEARWASDAAIQRGRGDVLSGTVRLVDPQTGETFQAGVQNRYYFRVVGQDGTVGTDTDFNPAPGLDLRRLLQVGVDIPDR